MAISGRAHCPRHSSCSIGRRSSTLTALSGRNRLADCQAKGESAGRAEWAAMAFAIIAAAGCLIFGMMVARAGGGVTLRNMRLAQPIPAGTVFLLWRHSPVECRA